MHAVDAVMQRTHDVGSLQRLRDELDGLRRAMRSQLHLASSDTRRQWIELEEKLRHMQLELKPHTKSAQ
jgi:hypothetical protein